MLFGAPGEFFRSKQFLVFFLLFKLILDHGRDIILYLCCHLLLHFCELFSIFVERLSLGNDILFLAVKTLINVSFFAFFLE